MRIERRTFIAGIALAGCEGHQKSTLPPTTPSTTTRRTTEGGEPQTSTEARQPKGSVPQRVLGATEEKVSAIGLGGYHLGVPSEAEAIRIMHRAIDNGITFFDNCWDYHEGESERRMGKALRGGKRDKVFLMTKIDGRTKEAARRQLEDSLHRLRVDHVDLVQIHEVIREKDPQWVFGEDGAVEALRFAQNEGKLRFIGFTGHKSPAIHLEMLRVADAHDFRFDTVQMPLNVMDPHYQSFQSQVLPILVKNHIGVLGMKPMGSGDILESNTVSAEECLRYALSLPTAVVITGCDSMPILEQAIKVGTSFEPLSEAEMQALLAKTRAAGKRGKYEAFKNTTRFDATHRHPEWLTSGKI